MKYMSTKEAEEKWNISERRIRKLIKDNRIEGAIKVGNSWNIPTNANKPIDKRTIKKQEFIIQIPNDLIKEIDDLKSQLETKEASEITLYSLKESTYLEWIYNSNAIEGNRMTLRETELLLKEGIVTNNTKIKEHLEVINHEKALTYIDELVNKKEPINEWSIKNIHQLILRSIDDKNAGKYRECNVKISGAKHIPPDYLHINTLMEELLLKYNNWNEYHPIIKSALFHGELVKIHPFIDGNGRTSRLIMNLILMKEGYLPVVIKNEEKIEYYEALDKAHTKKDYTDFIKIIAKLEKEILENYLSFI